MITVEGTLDGTSIAQDVPDWQDVGPAVQRITQQFGIWDSRAIRHVGAPWPEGHEWWEAGPLPSSPLFTVVDHEEMLHHGCKP